MGNQMVDPAIYDKNYFLADNDGWREWKNGLDSNLHPKFKRALELAGPLAGKNVLDIGCGRGELVYYCVKNGASALGIDYSQAAIEIANKTLKSLPLDLQQKAKAAVGNAESYNFTERYDVIFMIEIAEHMYDWQLREAINKIKPILSPGGKLIIMTPNYLYEKYFSPIKRISNIPINLIKWPVRILRGKYRPESFQGLVGKIFKINIDRGKLNRKMHVNVTTRGTLKRLLIKFDTNIWCEDHSINPLAILTRRWFGRDIIAIAAKRRQ